VARVEDAYGCFIEQNITVNATIVTCDLALTSIEIDDVTTFGGNDGEITINATSTNTPIEYSLDGITYQLSNVFSGLTAGLKAIYIKDDNNCSIVDSVIITQPAEVPVSCFEPTVTISDALPIRFVEKKCSGYLDKFYSELSSEGVYFPCYMQKMINSDIVTIQIVYEDLIYSTVPHLAIYGLDDDVLLYSEEMTFITNDTYESAIDLSIANISEKKIYIKLLSGAMGSPTTFYYEFAKSEPIHVSDFHNETTLITYSDNRDFAGIKYEDTNYVNRLRVESDFWQTKYPQEDEKYVKSNGVEVPLRSRVRESLTLRTAYCPAYQHKIITLAMSHLNIEINGNFYTKAGNYEFENENKYSLAMGKIELSDKNYYKQNLK
jgi:hypothetical protein